METGSDRASSEAKRFRESRIAQVLTSSKVHSHKSALFTTGLPILQVALNTEIMTSNLSPLVAALDHSPEAPKVVHANLVAYKQGNRGLIRYDIAHPPDESAAVVLGKLYPDPVQATRVHGVMDSLWREVFAGNSQLSVPRPLGCVPELAMHVALPLEGSFLDDVILDDGALEYMDRVAAWLDALHGARLDLDRRFDLDRELVNLRAWSVLIAHRHSDEGAEASRLVDLLSETARHITLEQTSPIHKDFHYQHIFVGRALGVIDFDEVRLGDRNFDVGHFCAHLHLLAARKPTMTPDTAASLQDRFLQSYSRYSGWTPDRRLQFFIGYACLKVAKQLSTTRGLRPRPEGTEELRQLRAMLDMGMRVVQERETGG